MTVVTKSSLFKNRGKRLTDKELVHLIVVQDKTEFLSEIYIRYSSKVFGTCLTYVHDRGIAEDLCHEIFIKVFTKIKTFSGKSSISTWIFSITRNYCIDYLRRQKLRRFQFMADYADVIDFESAYFTDENVEEDLLTMKDLEKVLPLIKKDEKEIIMMKYYEGRSINEIKDDLNISESAAKMRVKRAKDRVRSIYQTHFAKEAV